MQRKIKIHSLKTFQPKVLEEIHKHLHEEDIESYKKAFSKRSIKPKILAK